MLNRLPLEVDCIWFESRPRIDIGIAGSKRGTVSFRGEGHRRIIETSCDGIRQLARSCRTVAGREQGITASKICGIVRTKRLQHRSINVCHPLFPKVRRFDSTT